MENDNGRISYSVGLDLSALRQDAEKSKNILSEIGTHAVRQGSIIDQAFGEAGAARGFNTLEAAIRAAGSEIKGMEFGTAEEKIGALSAIIKANEEVLAENVSLLHKWQEDAAAAFAAGDTGTLEAITQDIDEQILKIQQLSEETEDYRNTLQAVMTVSGMGSETVSVPRLYDSEEDIRHVEELRQKIAETQAEISRLGADGGDTTQLTVELSGLKDELNQCEQAAAETASKLGSDLGGRAAEAQQSLYQLNTAITSQEEVVARLSQALEEAKAKYEEIQQTEGAASDEVERAAALYDTLSESLTNAQERLAGLQAAQQTAQVEWQNVSNEIQTHDSIIVKMLGGYKNYQAILGKLPQPLQSVIGGIQGMTGAAKAFIATPLGAILAAIILSVKALTTWFNSSAEGQMAFAKVSGYVGGVLNQLKEIVIAVGKAIYNAFSDPKQAVKDLWAAIKENIVNRFKSVGEIASALGTIIKAAFTLDTDGIKSGLKDLTDGLLKFGTGVDNLTGKVAQYGKAVHAAASENANIAVENRELEIQVSEWQKRNQELEQIKAKARGKMSNTSLSTDERRKAKKEFEDALNEQFEAETRFADKRIGLQQRSMALTSNTIEDENKLRDLEAEKLAIETRREQQLAMIQRRAGSMTNTENSEAAQREREQQKQQQALVSLGEMEANIILSNQQAELSIMKEGHAKRMKELDQERDEQLQKLEEMKNKFSKLNKTAGVETGEDGLTDVQRAQIVKGRSNVERIYQKGVQDILEDELADILSYEQKRLKIQEDYAKKRQDLYVTDENGNPTDTLRTGVTQGNVNELNRQEKEALKAVDEQFAQRQATYEAWCNQIADLSLERILNLLEQAEKELSEMEGNGASEEQLATARAKVNTLKDAKKEKQANKDVEENLSPDKRSIKEWKELYEVLNECTRQFEELGGEIGGTVGEIISAAGQIATSTLSMINGITTLAKASSEGIGETGKAASKAVQTVEKASVILTVITAALQVATAIANLFNNDESKQKEIEHLQERIDQLQWELGNQDVVQLQKNSGEAIERVRKAMQETRIELVRAKLAVNDFSGAWKAMTQSVSKNNVALEKTVKKLADAYGNMAYTADKALGGNKYDNARTQLENISQQQILIQEQIQKEKSKKKTDQSKIEDWERDIEELGQQAVEIINEMVEEIIGGSSSDIAEELSDAFFEAFQNGEDYAEAWGDKVNEIVSDVMKRMLVQKYLEEPLGEVFDKYKKKWFPNGDGTNAIDNVIASMGEFEADLNQVGENWMAVWEALPESIKSLITVTDEATREASSKGIATASQESVDELNGRATAIQGHTYSICENTKLLVANTNLILQSVLNIERHTEAISGDLSAVRKNVKEVKDIVNDIAIKGVKLK